MKYNKLYRIIALFLLVNTSAIAVEIGNRVKFEGGESGTVVFVDAQNGLELLTVRVEGTNRIIYGISEDFKVESAEVDGKEGEQALRELNSPPDSSPMMAGLRWLDFYNNVVKIVLEVASNDDILAHEFTVENCKINFKKGQFSLRGNCMTKSQEWQAYFLDRISEFCLCERVNNLSAGAGVFENYNTEDGQKLFQHYHFFNVIQSRLDPHLLIIVDSTYLQFFQNGGKELGLSPIFIGTHDDLVKLLSKYRRQIQFAGGIEFPLKEFEVERFAKKNWPLHR